MAESMVTDPIYLDETAKANGAKLDLLNATMLGGVACEEELEDIELTCEAVGLDAHDGQEDKDNGN